jgi:tRNA nucleotidyltransferase/poly(A) polymerase
MPASPMVLWISEQLQGLLQQEPAQVYFVGGCVRDLLMGRPLHDLDLVVAGDAISLARTTARAFHAAFVLLDEANGIARVVLRGQEEGAGSTIDFARMRGGDLAVDLAARELTINAMAMAPAAFQRFVQGETARPEVVDPFGGQQDLAAGRLRAVSRQVLHDDPLRMMRAVRFAGELGFAIAPETAGWIHESAGLLTSVSWERIRDELARLLACPHAAPYLPLLDSLGLLPHVLPEIVPIRSAAGLERPWETVCCLEWIAAGLGEQAPTEREEPFWQPVARQTHPDLVLNLPYAAQLRRYLEERLSGERPRLVLLKLAALLRHGDGPTEGRERCGRQVAQRLRLSAREALALGTATAWPADLERTVPGEASRRAVYRFYRDAGETATGILLLALAEDLAHAGRSLDREKWAYLASRANWILTLRYEHPADVITPPRLLDGSELMRLLELQPGPLIGQLLEDIREAQASGEVRTREEALAWARRALEM